MTVDGHTHELARPFLVLATQNPVEYEGTYPLPEAQLDRFMVRLSLGYPTPRPRPRCSPTTQSRDRVLDARAGRRPSPRSSTPRRTRARACTPARRCAATSSRCSSAPASDDRVELGASPARGPDAAARREGAARSCTVATTRCPTTSRRSPSRCSPPPAARPRGGGRRRREIVEDAAGTSSRAVKRAAGSAALGALLLLCAATFAMRSMYVPGITFLVLGLGFAIWVTLARGAPARLERESGRPASRRTRLGRCGWS